MSIWKHDFTLEAINNPGTNTINQHLDIVFTKIGDDFLEARMPVDHRTHQPMGLLHGGASVVLAETLGSCAGAMCVSFDEEYVVGLDINANHIKAVKSGFVYGTAKPVHIGKKTQVWEIRIVNEKQELVCISRITLAVIKKS